VTERGHGHASVNHHSRPPLLLLLIPPAMLLLVAAATPTASLFPDQGDLELYRDRMSRVLSGGIPYRDFPFEYPPLALVPIAFPALPALPFGPVTLDAYKWLFACWQAGLVLVLGLVLGQVVRLRDAAPGTSQAPIDGAPGVETQGPAETSTAGASGADVSARAEAPKAGPEGLPGGLGRAQLWLGIRLSILTAGAALAMAWRYDLFPALISAVALWLALAGRPALTGAAVGAGVMAKLYPLALVPALAARWLIPLAPNALSRIVAGMALTVVVVLLPFLALAGRETLSFLSYQAARGLQIESIGGGLVLVAGLVRGETIPIVAPFSAAEVTGGLADATLVLLPLVTAAAFALLAWISWGRMQEDVAATGRVSAGTIVSLATASLLVLLVTSKVLSIQYMVWIVPFAALLGGGRFWLVAAMVALTMPIHPILYDELVRQEVVPVLLLNLRNLMLVTLTMLVLADLRRPLVRGPEADSARPGRPEESGEVARPAGLEPTTFRSAT
jgi:hypothetical protein